MTRDDPVLIEAVVNGVASKASNPNVPRSHEEIRRDILGCCEAGASIVHSHDADGSSGPGDAESYATTWGPVLEKLPGAIGDTIELDEVLLTSGDAVKIGTPRVEGAKVLGTIVAQGRGPKIVVFKLKRRKNYRRKQGHRQAYTEIRIDKIEG